MIVNQYLRAGAIVRNARGELLVVRHGDGRDAFWTCPGGLLNVGESLSYALRRSVLAQSGYQLRIGGVACVGEVTIARTDRRRVEVYFVAEAVGCDERARNGRVAWMLPPALTKRFLPGAVLASIGRGECGAYLGNVTDRDRPLPLPAGRRRFRAAPGPREGGKAR